MVKRSSMRLIAVPVFVLSFVFITNHSINTESSAYSSKQKPADQKTAQQVYKNIQVLKDLPAAELDGVMNFMSAALGVGCTYCHTNPWNSDEKTGKVAARRMILMTRSINREHFSDNPAVTCYTCHRGQHNSVPNPPIDIATLRSIADESFNANQSVLPTTDEVIGKYLKSIGNETAIAELKSRVSRGTETTTNRMTPPQKVEIEILQVAPDKLLIARNSPRGATIEGYDGSRGWTKDARGQREVSGDDLAAIKQEADFFRFLRIRDTYPQLRVLAKDKIGTREVFVVGATSREDEREKLYFDAGTGLLLRKSSAFKTAFGTIPEVTDYDDYREVSGVKIPFTVTWSRPPFGAVRKFTEIKVNSAEDQKRFAAESSR